MFKIKGKKWITKFSSSTSAAAESVRTSANISVGALAAIGLVNSVGVFWVWYSILSDFSNTDFWLTWFSVMLLNGILWVPITVAYPASLSGGLTTAWFMKTFA